MLDIALRRLNLPLAAVEEKLSAAWARLIPQIKRPAKVKRPISAMGEAPKAAEKKVHMPPQAEGKPEAKEKEAKPEKPKTENLDTSTLLKKKKRREQ
jgi:DNA replication initiation complex subunit (GINS family)